MKSSVLGKTNLKTSPICLGTGNFGEKLNKNQAFEIMDAYVQASGRYIH